MQRHITFLHLAFFAALFTPLKPAFADYTDINVLGTSDAICIDGVESKTDFQQWTVDNESTVRAVLTNAKWSGDPDKLLQLIAQGSFVEKSYYPGTDFDWLSTMSDGNPVALPKRKWAGSAPFKGYEISIDTPDGTDTIVVPLVCCNFALLSNGVPIMVPQKVALTTPKPEAVTTVKPALLSALKPFIRLGVGSETSRFAKSALNTNCEKCEVKPQDQFNPQKPQQQTNNTETQAVAAKGTRDVLGSTGVRFGAELPIGQTLSFSSSVGLVGRTSTQAGNAYPDTSFHLDLELRKTFADFWFVSAGIGKWNIGDDDYDSNSTFVSAGSRLTERVGWFVEQRQFSNSATGADNVISAGVSITK